MRLNGWQRIGVVLSVLWAISSFFWFRHSYIQNAYAYATGVAFVCVTDVETAKHAQQEQGISVAQFNAYEAARAACQDRYQQDKRQAATYAIWLGIAVAVVPIVIVWLFIRVILWVVAGFRNPSD